MKIALVRRRFSPTGGAEHYLEGLLAGLAARGHAVTLWCESWAENTTARGAVRTVPTRDPLAFAVALERERLMESYDLVFSLERVKRCHVYRAGDGLHRVWLQRRAEYAPVRGRLRNWFNAKNRALVELEGTLLRPENVRGVIANSTMVQREIVTHLEFPEARIAVVPNGVDYPRYASGDRVRGRVALGLAPEDYVVLLVGAGAERKGHRYLREAMGRLKHSRKKLLIIDTPPAVEMPDVYAAADVFVLPTIYDPFANVTLEALAAGLPVITTEHNGATEIMTPGLNGLVLARADAVDQLTMWLQELSDPERRGSFRGPAQALAREYSWERNVTTTLEVCERFR